MVATASSMIDHPIHHFVHGLCHVIGMLSIVVRNVFVPRQHAMDKVVELPNGGRGHGILWLLLLLLEECPRNRRGG